MNRNYNKTVPHIISISSHVSDRHLFIVSYLLHPINLVTTAFTIIINLLTKYMFRYDNNKHIYYINRETAQSIVHTIYLLKSVMHMSIKDKIQTIIKVI